MTKALFIDIYIYDKYNELSKILLISLVNAVSQKIPSSFLIFKKMRKLQKIQNFAKKAVLDYT